MAVVIYRWSPQEEDCTLLIRQMSILTRTSTDHCSTLKSPVQLLLCVESTTPGLCTQGLAWKEADLFLAMLFGTGSLFSEAASHNCGCMWASRQGVMAYVRNGVPCLCKLLVRILSDIDIQLSPYPWTQHINSDDCTWCTNGLYDRTCKHSKVGPRYCEMLWKHHHDFRTYNKIKDFELETKGHA